MIINRYHWPLDYVLWAVPWGTLQLMMSDALRVDYKSQSQKTGTSGVSMPDVLDMNDPNSINILLKMAGTGE